jgi:hypothetical protein
MQGYAAAEVAMQNAAAFARDRLQSRSVKGAKAPDKPADPIIVHPDVRRMLMDTRAFVEGARALTFWAALHEDMSHKAPEEADRQKSNDYMALLTPVIKAYLTDKGTKGANDSLQVFGGSGYCEEWGMSQFVRDVRIAMIYEGTNGIQALDLVGRKLMAEGGRYWQTFFAEIDEWCEENKGTNHELDAYIEKLLASKAELTEATQWLGMNAMKDFDQAGAASTDYLHLFGIVALGYMWVMMAKEAIDREGDADPFYKNKLITAKYFFDRVIVESSMHLAKVKTGTSSMMELDAEAF